MQCSHIAGSVGETHRCKGLPRLCHGAGMPQALRGDAADVKRISHMCIDCLFPWVRQSKSQHHMPARVGRTSWQKWLFVNRHVPWNSGAAKLCREH